MLCNQTILLGLVAQGGEGELDSLQRQREDMGKETHSRHGSHM